MDTNFKFAQGSVVKDIVTGFKGVVTGRTDWLNGCNTYVVKSQTLKDGVPTENQHFDEPQLELVKGSIFKSHRETGGPEKKMKEPNRL